MNRTRIVGSALVAAALTLSAAGSASADPVISTSQGEVPTEGAVYDSFDILAQGCVNPGGDAFFGGFVIDTANPEAPFTSYQELTSDGNWTWPVYIGEDTTFSTYEAYFYCAQGPVASATDDNMLWVSPAYSFTISDQPRAARTAMASLSRAAATDSAPSTDYLTVDRESSPLVDRMGIGGERAAELKAKVDAKADAIGEINRLTEVFGGRPATAAELKTHLANLDAGKKTLDTIASGMTSLKDFTAATKGANNPEKIAFLYENAFGSEAPSGYVNYLVNEIKAKRTTLAGIGRDFANSGALGSSSDDDNFVTSAYVVLGNRLPSAEQLAEQLDLLHNTLSPRVQIVENIALQVGVR